ncbi:MULTISPECIES: hypothetical protein [Janthinobacterium]|uniref:hypothetical protein n=1 Tax=Janthinobacterium TaxID=29580 RepID=UPI0005365DE0|nr:MULTISPECIES: hypothetical protein [Janthinobacterium]KHA80315.1 hypothetical protein NC77_02705 [Janthinobacterium lividum]PHV49442.1 hypothetical protein CSQ91_18750 [Janthinobacterium sp. BJB301]QKY05630.1 hypothetical protein G3257_27540 [Janthinobacterium lividum]QKY11259.1 hypothetical protein G8765_28260 [Janthinobacterium lividum]
MKNLYLRSMLAAACAVTLAACGGSGGNLYLQGQVVGLAKDGLILLNDGESLPIPAGQASFVFTKLVKNDDRYNITIAQQPKGAVCTIINGVGKASSYSVTTAQVNCQTNAYPLSGTVTGLTADGLRLVMGPNGTTLLAGATTYEFKSVDDGASYGISILAQPTGLTCRFQGSSSADGSDTVGKMGSAATTAATLDCKPQ